MSINKIMVCGLGKLGACLAVAYAEADIEVVGYDTDPAKVELINGGGAPVDEPGLSIAYSRRPLRATRDLAIAVESSQACFFVLPTPSLPNNGFNDRYVSEALRDVARAVARLGKKNYVFVITSTVSPGTCAGGFLGLLKRELGPIPFGLVYKPEFIALGNVLNGLRRPEIMLIGHNDAGVAADVSDLCARVIENTLTVHTMSFTEAEVAKLALNCFVTMKISFANQVDELARNMGCDPVTILGALGDDARVGKQCLQPGLPFGGPCFPRDNRAFVQAAFSAGADAPLAQATDGVNHRTRQLIFDRVISACASTRAPIVGILGLAYKPGTSVVEESLGAWLRGALRAVNIPVFSHDPWAPHDTALDDVLSRSSVLVFACHWPEYESIEPRPGVVVIDPALVRRAAKELSC